LNNTLGRKKEQSGFCPGQKYFANLRVPVAGTRDVDRRTSKSGKEVNYESNISVVKVTPAVTWHKYLDKPLSYHDIAYAVIGWRPDFSLSVLDMGIYIW
jgi:hypothetical protein